MKIAIIAALTKEIDYYLKTIPNLTRQTIAHVTIWQGEYAGHTLLIAQSGIGKVNAAIATTLVSEQQPDLLINTGSAGAVDPTLEVGDVVIGTETRHHDVDATAFGMALGQVEGLPVTFPCDARYVDALAKTVKQGTASQVVQGLIVSGDSFIANPAKVKWLQTHFQGAQCVEMEAASIGQVAHQFQIPYLVVRAISDTASQDADVLFEQFIDEVGEKSAQTTLAFVEQLA
ncbi:MAG: 5'-methylthioadenosine/adenosylhomocysteine nucleosidase [Aerococcus sp.]|nr:5'-methylthioadenosine/adenosylhomocysteine nucleosidase [Aerococcus sp.]